MRTALAIDDFGNRSLDDSESCGEAALGFASKSSKSNFGDVIVAKFADAGHRQTGFYGVGVIPQTVNPFEIRNPIVRLDRADVVDLRQVERVWDEGQSHKPMNGYVSGERLFAEVDGRITSLVGFGEHDLSVMVSFSAFADPNSLSFQASHSAEIAHFIQVGELRDGNASPFFDHFESPSCFMASSNVAYATQQGV